MPSLTTRLDTERGSGRYEVQTRRKALHGWWEVGDVIHGADYPQSNLTALEAMGEIVRLEEESVPEDEAHDGGPLSGAERSRRYRERKAQRQAPEE